MTKIIGYCSIIIAIASLFGFAYLQSDQDPFSAQAQRIGLLQADDPEAINLQSYQAYIFWHCCYFLMYDTEYK